MDEIRWNVKIDDPMKTKSDREISVVVLHVPDRGGSGDGGNEFLMVKTITATIRRQMVRMCEEEERCRR